MARLGRAGLVAALLGASVVLSARGAGTATSQARTSCRFVTHALALQTRSEAPGLSATQRDVLRGQAMSELLRGSAAAARATSSDGSWNALQTTIEEAERVPLTDLAPALRRLCKVADSTTPYL